MSHAKVVATEIRDGLEYDGTISVEDKVIHYHLTLPQRIDILDKERNLNPVKLLGETSIEAKIDDKVLSLDEMEKGFVFAYGFTFCRNLFYSDQREGLRHMGIGSDVLEDFYQRLIPPAESGKKNVKHSLEGQMPIDLTNPVVRRILSK